GARAPDEAREQVAAHFVGAEPVGRRRRLAHGQKVGLHRVVRRDVGGGGGDGHEGQDDGAGGHRGRPARQAPEGRRASGRGGRRHEVVAHASPRSRGLARKYRTSASRLSSTYRAAETTTTPCTTA